jgi:hypothetical protein
MWIPNQWQLSEIQAALTEAQAQDYATDRDMDDLALKWQAGPMLLGQSRL